MEILSEDLDKAKFPLRIIEPYYKDIEKIGKGAFGIVYKAYELSSGRNVAIKQIAINKNKDSNELLKEIDLLKNIEHTNIVEYYNYYKDEDYIYIIMEYLKGGTLKEYINENKENITENDARIIIKQLLHALSYLHYTCDICHRDIKPENVMLTEKNNISLIKLVDFGLSSDCFEAQNVLDNCGTLIYMAPEQISKKTYSKGVDIWSVGIILYMLLNKGKHPFYNIGDKRKAIIDKINEKEIEFDPNCPISPIGKHFLYKLLDKNPSYRYTARPALIHPWITLKKFDKIPMTIYDKIIMDEYAQKLLFLILTSSFMLKYKKTHLTKKIKKNIFYHLRSPKVKMNHRNSMKKELMKNQEEQQLNGSVNEINLKSYEQSVFKSNLLYEQKFKEKRESMFLLNNNDDLEVYKLFPRKQKIKKNNEKKMDKSLKEIDINENSNIINREKSIYSTKEVAPLSPKIRKVSTLFSRARNNSKNIVNPIKMKLKLSNNNLISKLGLTPDLNYQFLKQDSKISSNLKNFKLVCEFKDENKEKNINFKRPIKLKSLRNSNESLFKSNSSRMIKCINKLYKNNQMRNSNINYNNSNENNHYIDAVDKKSLKQSDSMFLFNEKENNYQPIKAKDEYEEIEDKIKNNNIHGRKSQINSKKILLENQSRSSIKKSNNYSLNHDVSKQCMPAKLFYGSNPKLPPIQK